MILALLLLAVPTFFHDVEPILQKHCLSCHREGEIAPMSFSTYAQVRPWAKAIREAVLSRKMPPWFAHGGGPFRNDPSLTPAEISVIRDWVEGGALKGNPRDGPGFVESWPVEAANLTVSMAAPFTVSPGDVVAYQYFRIPVGLAGDRWIRFVDIRPSERSLVHHAVLYVREKGAAWDERSADILAVYTPGTGARRFLPGMAKKLPAGSDLVLQVHYTAGKRVLSDRTSVALGFFDGVPEKRVLTLQMDNVKFRIPPGERDFVVRAYGTLPQDVLLLSMFPHMHLRGSAFEYEIVEPGGGRFTTLLEVKPYDFYWQLQYELAQPRLLKAGTRLIWTAHFDNSRNNPRNPDPTAEVGWGEQSWDEMMVGFFEVAVDLTVTKSDFLK